MSPLASVFSFSDRFQGKRLHLPPRMRALPQMLDSPHPARTDPLPVSAFAL
ncbi:MAG: hypothetical protein VKI42_00990 [Synechococcaceae cyanobacterium]|nr:hypothetical protein [Synechococcaceae cyanobacterium]